MHALIPICLADFFAIKALAVLVLGLVAYLYWTGLREKREQRRDRRWLETKRREIKERAARKAEQLPPVR